ncbi:MAG: lysozyme [Patescibacteria group bacterium]|nr:lysozyme [Patescibacteria group bacterium]
MNFEGCRLQAYQDQRGIWTIGYGHTAGVTPSEVITQGEANELLANDLRIFEAGVNSAVEHSITPNQFSALVSFAFNVGITAFEDSTLLRLVNDGDYAGAQQQFARWVWAGNVVDLGLQRRRAAEAALFATA